MSFQYLEESNWNYRLFVVPIMFFLVAFFSWAYFAQIDESVKGSGKVIPHGQTRLIQHLEGGIITDILIAEGDTVEKGEILFRIQNQYFTSVHKENIIKLAAFKAKLERLLALLAEEKNVVFSEDILEEIPAIIQSEIQIFHEQKKKHASELSVLQEQLLQKKAQLKEMEVRFENLLKENSLAQEGIKIQEEMNKKGAISRERYLQHLSSRQKLHTQLEEVRYTIPIIQKEIGEWDNKINAKVFEMRSRLLQELSEVQVEIKKLQETLKADKDRNLRIGVTSPTKGVVNKVHFNTIGGIVKSGETIAEISPLEEELMIEARINTSDRAYVYPGQTVSVEITAYDFSKYGTLKGSLVSISADSSTDEKGNNFYTIKVRADDYKFDDDSPILIGMTANINILTGKRTILHYLIKPMKDIKHKALSEH